MLKLFLAAALMAMAVAQYGHGGYGGQGNGYGGQGNGYGDAGYGGQGYGYGDAGYGGQGNGHGDAGYGGQGNGHGDAGYGGQGHSDYAQPTPYHYGYDIVGGDHHSGDFKQTRQEKGDGHGNVEGSYSYSDAHGNQRVVKYVADHHGFRAQVQTNEPGTESQSPADVQLHSSAPNHQQSSGYGYGSSLGGLGSSLGGHGLY